MDCSIFDYVQRWSLVLSNLLAIFPLVYLITLTIKRNIKWFTLIPSMIFVALTGICSFIYHMSDAGPECSKVIVADYSLLYNLDFIFSYQIIHVVFAYAVDPIMTIFQVAYLSFTLILNIFYVVYLKNDYDNYFYALIIFIGAIVTITRFVYLYCTKQLSHEMNYHFDIRAGIPALVCVIIAFAFKIGTPNEFNYYWWGHSLWHAFIFTGIFFCFNIYDMSPMFGCVSPRECIECSRGSCTNVHTITVV